MPLPGSAAFSRHAKRAAILALLLALVLVGQPFSFSAYRVGVVLLIVASLVQIAFGNMKDGATYWGGVTAVAITVALTGALVVIGIFLAPSMVALGQ